MAARVCTIVRLLQHSTVGAAKATADRSFSWPLSRAEGVANHCEAGTAEDRLVLIGACTTFGG